MKVKLMTMFLGLLLSSQGFGAPFVECNVDVLALEMKESGWVKHAAQKTLNPDMTKTDAIGYARLALPELPDFHMSVSAKPGKICLNTSFSLNINTKGETICGDRSITIYKEFDNNQHNTPVKIMQYTVSCSQQ